MPASPASPEIVPPRVNTSLGLQVLWPDGPDPKTSRKRPGLAQEFSQRHSSKCACLGATPRFELPKKAHPSAAIGCRVLSSQWAVGSVDFSAGGHAPRAGGFYHESRARHAPHRVSTLPACLLGVESARVCNQGATLRAHYDKTCTVIRRSSRHMRCTARRMLRAPVGMSGSRLRRGRALWGILAPQARCASSGDHLVWLPLRGIQPQLLAAISGRRCLRLRPRAFRT